MIRILSFFISVIISCASYANDTSSVVEANSDNEPIKKIITYEVKKEVLPLPTCSDDKLIEKTKEFVRSYYDQNSNDNSVVYRRKKHFVLKSLNDFTKENVANYKTEKSRPISDVIAELKVNEKVIEENILLCKNNSQDKYSNNIYLLAYPKGKGYKVFVLNLDKKQHMNNFFEYE